MRNVAGEGKGLLTTVSSWLEEALRNLQEAFRDRTREKLCGSLAAIGIEARLAEAWRPEETTGPGSLGLIDIAGSPIRWVNVRRVVTGSGEYMSVEYFTESGVPDSRALPEMRIESVRVRTFPVLGKVIDVRWKGEDAGLGIGQRLSSDESTRASLMAGSDVTIEVRPGHRCWLITPSSTAAPSWGRWGLYEAIARNLLGEGARDWETRVPALSGI